MTKLALAHRTAAALACILLLQGCVSTLYNVPSDATDAAVYGKIYPYYAEFCAVSEMRKLPGSQVDIDSGGPGGHAVFYLNGVCRVADAHYPVVSLCDHPGPDDGVGISVNAHYRNANWVATPGHDFFFHGGLPAGAALTPAAYARTQAQAKQLGLLDGVQFQAATLKDQPPGMSERDFKYEISVSTDYAINFGRDRYCARVPLDRGRMAVVVNALNAANAPYRSGARQFEWSVLRNNCAHLAHNALAAVGVWKEWPIERPVLLAAFDFPVPKNEFVNLMRRTNDLPIADPEAIGDDDALRGALLEKDWLATRPGGLAEAEHAVLVNSLYDTHLRLIFYDEAMFGHYQERFEAIFKDPRYTDLHTNLVYFADLYADIQAKRPARFTGDDAAFERVYYEHIAAEQDVLATTRKALAAAGS